MLGFGGGDGEQRQPDANGERCAPGEQSYDPNGMFRVLGNGEFTPAQLKNLTEEERTALLRRLGREGSL